MNNDLCVENVIKDIEKNSDISGMVDVVQKKTLSSFGLSKNDRKILKLRDIEFLKFCYDQIFLTRQHIISWLLKNTKISTKSSAKTTSFHLTNFLIKNEFLIKDKNLFLNDDNNIFKCSSKAVKLLKGRGLVSAGCRVRHVDEATIYHDYMVTNVRLLFQNFERIQNWTCESEHKELLDKCVPDASCQFINGHDKFSKLSIEIELTEKCQGRYEEKFKEYENSDSDIVLYFVSSKKISDKVLTVAENISDKIYCCLLSDFVELYRNAEMYNKSSRLQLDECFGREK